MAAPWSLIDEFTPAQAAGLWIHGQATADLMRDAPPEVRAFAERICQRFGVDDPPRYAATYGGYGGRPAVVYGPRKVTREQLVQFAAELGDRPPFLFAAVPAARTPTAPPDTTGMVTWMAVMIESWPAIVEAHGPGPTARHVLSWVKKHGPPDVIPAEQPDREALRWIDSMGGLQTTPIKTISNRIGELRKAGTIPPG